MNTWIRNADNMVIRVNETLFKAYRTGFSFNSLPLTSPILCLGYYAVWSLHFPWF
jgi:hypothetical protein